MIQKEKILKIQETLDALYPETPVPLDHTDDYSLLVAVLLSAQCTDIRVNLVTPHLWKLAATPQKMVKQEIEAIREIIKPCGLSPTKSKNIWNLSKQLLENHDGKVPNTFKELEALPGVGHKTASVVMAQAFGVPAFPVDTHIHRLAQRWGLTQGKNVKTTEADLKRLFAEAHWNKLHLQIIFFGREYCAARTHDYGKCPICSFATPKVISSGKREIQSA